MPDPMSITISVLALIVSATTAWLTLFRKGFVRMTQPTVVFFGPDGSRQRDKSLQKIYLRTLLFATSKRGRVIESMHVTINRNETRQNFNIWVYGDDKLVRGSGLFVGETGVAANHHFLLPAGETDFAFREGSYRLDVYAQMLGDKRATLLFSQVFEVGAQEALALADQDAGLYFDWGPDSGRYLPHVDRKPEPVTADGILRALTKN
jgi:hypothetical protein